MGSDRARRTYDAAQHYHNVVMQQGRVLLESDWNESQEILQATLQQTALAVVGPSGTSDDGYRIVFPEGRTDAQFDFYMEPGTMLVGGQRIGLRERIAINNQPDWKTRPRVEFDAPPERELAYLEIYEQEISATEDPSLRDVALGGPDTCQRTRLMQRVHRLPVSADNRGEAVRQAQENWQREGFTFEPQTMRLLSRGSLKVGFQIQETVGGGRETQAHGGYIGEENQLIRVQISAPDRFVWGFDNASFLYRADVVDAQTLHLRSRPVDAYHQPRAGQAVELLRPGAKLPNGALVAEPNGFVAVLTSPYDPDTQTLRLNASMPAEYLRGEEAAPEGSGAFLYVRVWEESLPLTVGKALALGHTGLTITFKGDIFQTGDHWLPAARPGAPTRIQPDRLLTDFQLPDGPRRWVCPLALIDWNDGQGRVLDDCRNLFESLTRISRREAGSEALLTLSPDDITPDNTLQTILDQHQSDEAFTLLLLPGRYLSPRPLRLTRAHSNLTIRGLGDDVILAAQPGTEAMFLDGLVVLTGVNNVTLEGLHFEIPAVPYGEGVRAAENLHAPMLEWLGGESTARLHVGVGLRPVDCDRLSVRNCQFQCPAPERESIFAVGIFGAIKCWKLNVQSCRFYSLARSLDVRQEPFRMLIGFLLAPSFSFPEATRRKDGGGVLLAHARLPEALFRDNLFARLTAAVLVHADVGSVNFEDNTVSDCYAGIWLLPLHALAYFDDPRAQLALETDGGPRLRDALHALIHDPVIQIGVTLARTYPLPAAYASRPEYRTRDAFLIEKREEDGRESARRTTFAQKITTFLEKVVDTVEGVPLPAEDVFLSGQGIGRFRRLHQDLSSYERQAMAHWESRAGLRLMLHVSSNILETTMQSGPSSVALLIWDGENTPGSQTLLHANTFRTCTPYLPAALLLMMEHCVVTGNLFLNEENLDAKQLLSLLLSPAPVGDRARAAITGNILRGQALLPVRQGLTAALNNWRYQNTEI
ncbi:MAG: hypothetical protein JWL77_3538 [Chthonomonadaceae bacterium]|nr:hypothetical protein [Chthonomonadaceae bacterium]